MVKKKADSVVPVGKKIKKERLKKKMSMDRVANETGFSIDDLKQIEAGKKIPPVGTLLQIARALQSAPKTMPIPPLRPEPRINT